jgi:hypothetical protein
VLDAALGTDLSDLMQHELETTSGNNLTAHGAVVDEV